MSDRPRTHQIKVDLSVEPGPQEETPDAAAPFCIALLGDFSARAHRGESGPPLASREPIPVDRDTVNDVLARLQPELHVRVPGESEPAVRIRFTALDDFHPDRLYERLPLFEGARELRQRLAEPGRPSGPPPGHSIEGRGSLLDQILQQSRPADEPSPLEGGDLQSYLNRIVAPNMVAPVDSDREALIAELDATSSGGVRALLHLPEFQALEALWRGVDLLTRQIESDMDVQLYMIDATKAELAGDQSESPDAPRSGLGMLLARPPAGASAAAWGALGAMYSFAPETADLQLLNRLGIIAQTAGAPVLAAGDPRLIVDGKAGAKEDPRWQALRRVPHARWIGLALPRFLLRMPYGELGTRCDALPFEELPTHPRPEDYLWGNPAIVCLLLPFRGGAMSLELDGLPIVPIAGTGTLAPCTEIVLSEMAAEGVLDHGLMALVSLRGTDRIRLVRFQSIAEPAQRLAGGWFGG